MQLMEAVDALQKNVQPEQWKNIPMPVCESTKSIVGVMHDLRKFVMSLDQRFQNLSSTVAQAASD